MKPKNLIISILMSLIVAVVGGTGLSLVIGVHPMIMIGCLFLLSFIPMPQLQGTAMETFYRQVWEKEASRSVDDALKDTFLDGIVDKSRYVTGNEEMQTINSEFFDVEPDVLINNSTYPLDVQTLDGTPVAITLDKYQTKPTSVTDDELFALAFDKIKEVNTSHANAIVKARLKKAIHALAPSENATATPVLLTTGAATADGSRLRLQWKDLITFREKWVGAGFSMSDLRLVLCPDHVNDLLLSDLSFQKSYVNFKGGIITNQLGFEIREYSENPYFNASTLAKLSYGAEVSTDTDRMASVVFAKTQSRKAKGLMKVYKSVAKDDPIYQRNLIAYRNYFICMPARQKYIGAVVSAIPE